VDVVVVSYNTRDHLAACLGALATQGASRIVVVDNASSDGSPDLVRQRYPHVVLHANTRNLGFGAAANQGIADCQSDYVLLLNTDTHVEPNALAALEAYLDSHPRVAIAGPRLVSPTGRLQASCYPFPSLVHTLMAESGLPRLLAHVPRLRERYLPTSSHTRTRRVPWVVGAALAIRRAAFESVGGFDRAFFMYFEEVDLCYRLAAAGWEAHFAPVATIAHVGSASTRQHHADMAVQYLASRRHFYRRHYARGHTIALVLMIDAIVLGRWLLNRGRLALARDEQSRARTRANLEAWERVLRGEWLRDARPAGG
jgi:GT2 family glycosyltransferase